MQYDWALWTETVGTWTFLPDQQAGMKEYSDTEDVANAIVRKLNSHSASQRLVISFYVDLVKSVKQHPDLKMLYNDNAIQIVIGGAWSHRLLLHDMRDLRSGLEYSDLDVTVYIDPRTRRYSHVRHAVAACVMLCLESHKQKMDSVFVYAEDGGLCKEDASRLRAVLDDEASRSGMVPMAKPSICVFETEDRSKWLSDMPWFPNSNAFLDVTPISCSINTALRFTVKPDDGPLKGKSYLRHFDLYRERFNFRTTSQQHVQADIIDVSIPHPDDKILKDFFAGALASKTREIKTPLGNVIVPTLKYARDELIRFVDGTYPSPQCKLQKRKERLSRLTAALSAVQPAWA